MYRANKDGFDGVRGGGGGGNVDSKVGPDCSRVLGAGGRGGCCNVRLVMLIAVYDEEKLYKTF